MSFVQRAVWVIFVWVVHEVNQVMVVILDRVSVEQDVLLAERSILLLLLDHLGMSLTGSVVVRDLGFKLYHGSRSLSSRLFDQIWRGHIHQPIVHHMGIKVIAPLIVVAVVSWVPVSMLIRVMRDGNFAAIILHSHVILFFSK